MNIENMRRILAIIDEGSISNAAKKLHISQPTLSQMVKSTETDLDTLLFDRRFKTLKLTYIGELFAIMARKVVNSYDAFEHDIRQNQQGVLGKIVVGTTIRRGMSYLPVILPELMEAYPMALAEQLFIPADETEAAILQGRVNVAIASVPPIHPRIKVIALNAEHFMLVVSAESDFAKRYAEYSYRASDPTRRGIPLIAAENERFVLPNQSHTTREVFQRIAQESGFLPSLPMEVSNIDMALGYVKAGLGVTIRPMILTADGTLCDSSNSFCYFFLQNHHTTRDVYLCYDHFTYLSSLQMRFVELMEKHFGVQSVIQAH